jgi:PAS domain S-box-containing protein
VPGEPTDERFKELVGTIDAIVTEYDRRTNRFTYISEQAERILGYPPERLEEALLSHVDEVDRMRIEAITARAIRERTDYAYEHRVRAADGRLVWLRVSASLVLDEHGEPALIRGVWLDVTALKEAEAARESSYSLLQATLDATADAILVVNVEGQITTYNRPFVELWPIPEAVLDTGDDAAALGSVVDRLADPEEFIRRVAEIYEDPECVTRDVFELLDGRTIERDSAPQRLGDDVVGRVWCFRDITEKLAAQEALSTREELFRSLIENASDAVTMFSADGTSLYESPSVERVLGYPPEELLGTKTFSLLHPDDREPVQRTFAAMLAGEEPVPILARLRHRDGNWRTVEAIGRRRSQDGEWVVVVNYRDVTDQHLLQEQLVHAQKLESIGRLAGGVAHDFNNLLTAIGGYSEFLVASFDDDDPRRADALEIVRASDRAAELTSQLLAFSRHQVLLAEILDLGEVVEELERLISGLLGDDVELSTSVTPGCRVRADGGQIEQVITNLVLNARDAMPAGGKVELAVSCVDGEVELTVTDTGVGMDAETVTHIFEPFFTTKDAGGHGPRPRDRLRNRQAVGRRNLRHIHAGRGVDVPHRPATLDRRRPGPGRAPGAHDRAERHRGRAPGRGRGDNSLPGRRGVDPQRLQGLRCAERRRGDPPARAAPRRDRPAADRRRHARHERPRPGPRCSSSQPNLRVLFTSGYAKRARRGVPGSGRRLPRQAFSPTENRLQGAGRSRHPVGTTDTRCCSRAR